MSSSFWKDFAVTFGLVLPTDEQEAAMEQYGLFLERLAACVYDTWESYEKALAEWKARGGETNAYDPVPICRAPR